MQRGYTLLLLGMLVAGCGRQPAAKVDPDLARFVAAKRAQTQQMPAAQTNGLPDTVWKIFDAAARGHFSRVTNLAETVNREAGRFATPPMTPLGRVGQALLQASGMQPRVWPGLQTEAWAPVHEVIGISEVYEGWDHKWMRRFGRDIIDSIPSNSIYFGGTDAGRFIVTALSEAHTSGQPFFTLTQNPLADGRYLDYLRVMYGWRIRIPTAQDSQQAFQDYLQDAQRRLSSKELKPGEDVRIVENRVQVSGQVAVMTINGLIAYNILTNNPDREFFLEESFPLDWMYPHLAPHGLIMKLHHEPLGELSEEIVKRDREYWTRYVKELIGDWVTPEASVESVCAFGRKVYLDKDRSGFTGDVDFARNEAAQKSYAKLRSAIGGVYAWRAKQAPTDAEKRRMNREAELAFKQALALCPHSPEAGYRCVQLLLEQQRTKEALQVAETLQAFEPKNTSIEQLVNQVRSYQNSTSTNQPAAR